MAYPFKRILTPIEFDDENSLKALAFANRIAQENDGTILLLHAVPMIIVPADVPVYREVYQPELDSAKDKLQNIGRECLGAGAKFEIVTKVGDAAAATVVAARELAADVVVIATHGRKGLSHLFLGSVAERVVRESPCPVITIRGEEGVPGHVEDKMTRAPASMGPEETLDKAAAKMREGGFRSLPVVEGGRLVGLLTEGDLHRHEGYLERTKVDAAMTREFVTVSKTTRMEEAARLMLEKKLSSLPVVEDGRLAGIITTSDILKAFVGGGGKEAAKQAPKP